MVKKYSVDPIIWFTIDVYGAANDYDIYGIRTEHISVFLGSVAIIAQNNTIIFLTGFNISL